MCSAKRHVRFTPESGHFAQKPLLRMRTHIGIERQRDLDHQTSQKNLRNVIIISNHVRRRMPKPEPSWERDIQVTT